jgi:lipopolysaccharide transport system ATP-binding protein
MSDIAIKVEGLGKRYKIGRLQRHDTLRDRIADARIFNLFKRRNGNGHRHLTSDLRPLTSDLSLSDSIWALKDVSFEVKRGEVVGIIGRNGAGKSTLLKILSRITEPTEGYADINGRIASLLEVGTGFHPELTGRENIFLNGSILGMKRAEIKQKFDEIVAFAEIEKFIDTPVKYYSSGMYVRLAFAVAAHLDPEILLVDEVLAVGDASFQKKCLGKMGDVAREGRTVLFVSHNMGAVQALCNRSMWVNQGRVVRTGETNEVVRDYLMESADAFLGDGVVCFGPETIRKGNGRARFVSVRTLDGEGRTVAQIPMGRPFSIEMEFECNEQLKSPIFGIGIDNYISQRIVSFGTLESLGETPVAGCGGKISVEISELNLLPGKYLITLGLSADDREDIDWIQHALTFEVTPFPVYQTGKIPNPDSGMIFAKCEWQCAYS